MLNVQNMKFYQNLCVFCASFPCKHFTVVGAAVAAYRETLVFSIVPAAAEKLISDGRER